MYHTFCVIGCVLCSVCLVFHLNSASFAFCLWVGIQEPQQFTFLGQRSERMERAMGEEKENIQEEEKEKIQEEEEGGRNEFIQEEVGRTC